MKGIINVLDVMRRARDGRERIEAWKHRQQSIEEREALYWWHRAENEDEQAHVQKLYSNALERYGKRKRSKLGY